MQRSILSTNLETRRPTMASIDVQRAATKSFRRPVNLSLRRTTIRILVERTFAGGCWFTLRQNRETPQPEYLNVL
jgi:hypothetical protein